MRIRLTLQPHQRGANHLSGLRCQEGRRMHCGGGVAVRRTTSEPSLTKRLRLTSFRLLVTAWGCTKHLLRVDVLVFAVRRTVASVKATPEKRFCALMPVFSIEWVVSKDTPS